MHINWDQKPETVLQALLLRELHCHRTQFPHLLPVRDPNLAFLELSHLRVKKAHVHITLCIAVFTPHQHLANWTW